MRIATIEYLTPKWYTLITRHRVLVTRVYCTDDFLKTVEPYPYKFFTVLSIRGKSCKIIGLNHCNVVIGDLRAIARAVKPLGVTKLHWMHHLRLHTLSI